MSDLQTIDAYGALSDDDTLTIRRLLPGPIERCWAYLTDSDLRRQWLASGAMEMTEGSSFELVWRNDELSDPPGTRPPGFDAEHKMQSRITVLDPPRKLAFTWGNTGGVSIDLESQGDKTLLTLVHRRLPPRPVLLYICAGWHAHLDLLVARANGRTPPPFWDGWSALKTTYEGRLQA